MPCKFTLYSPLQKWKKGDRLVSPFVKIQLNTYSEDQDGRIIISSDLMSDKEIDETIDHIVKEFERLRKAAKSELKTIRHRQIAK